MALARLAGPAWPTADSQGPGCQACSAVQPPCKPRPRLVVHLYDFVLREKRQFPIPLAHILTYGGRRGIAARYTFLARAVQHLRSKADYARISSSSVLGAAIVDWAVEHSLPYPGGISCHLMIGDATHSEAIARSKVYSSCTSTTAVTAAAVQTAMQNDAVEELQTMYTFALGDLLTVEDGSGAETYAIIDRAIRSTGCPSFVDEVASGRNVPMRRTSSCAASKSLASANNPNLL